ncbi:MAG: hypothetical protein K0R17_1487 [Rariglobus sp.]|jgi:hypothetical protein|nr:hypothetical protein [Rariglobus sp.]
MRTRASLLRRTLGHALRPLGLVFFFAALPAQGDEPARTEFGVCANPQARSDPDAYCDHLIASGVKWVRISPEWGLIETARGIYNAAYLDKLDAIVNRLHAGGVGILWILCYTAPWASSKPDLPSPDLTRHKPADWADWGNYVTFIVSRYDGKIKNWEVWNEPDLDLFWKDGVADYHTLLVKAHARIKAVNPGNTVVLGGLAMFDGTVDSYGLDTFFDRLLALGAARSFDVTNYHAYGPHSRQLALRQGMLDVINKYGLHAKPLWITETGYSTAGDLSLEAVKADRVDQIHHGNLRRDDVARYFWYCFDNQTLARPDPKEENFGLVSADLSPRKAFYRYQARDGAATDFAAQAAYPSLAPSLHTLYYVSDARGDGGLVTASGDARVIPAGRYMYFRVNDDWLHAGNAGLDERVDVDVTFLDSGTGAFALQYDSTTEPYRSVTCALTNSGRWRTVTFTLDDVKFANRQNHASDLRLYAHDAAALTVRKVTVRKRRNHAAAVLATAPAGHSPPMQ